MMRAIEPVHQRDRVEAVLVERMVNSRRAAGLFSGTTSLARIVREI